MIQSRVCHKWTVNLEEEGEEEGEETGMKRLDCSLPWSLYNLLFLYKHYGKHNCAIRIYYEVLFKQFLSFYICIKNQDFRLKCICLNISLYKITIIHFIMKNKMLFNTVTSIAGHISCVEKCEK